jgi:hypothetical protein
MPGVGIAKGHAGPLGPDRGDDRREDGIVVTPSGLDATESRQGDSGSRADVRMGIGEGPEHRLDRPGVV